MSSSKSMRITAAATAGLAARRRKRPHALVAASSPAMLGLTAAIVSP